MPSGPRAVGADVEEGCDAWVNGFPLWIAHLNEWSGGFESASTKRADLHHQSCCRANHHLRLVLIAAFRYYISPEFFYHC